MTPSDPTGDDPGTPSGQVGRFWRLQPDVDHDRRDGAWTAATTW